MIAELFERAPRFLARLDADGPYDTIDDLFVAARRIAHAMPEEEQIELIDAHPRLGAPPGTVSAMSHTEQGYDRETGTEPTESTERTERTERTEPTEPRITGVAAELEWLNDAYEARFGFRYCVFVAGRPREALLPGMAAALAADRDAELHRALDAVVDIAIDRHAKLIPSTARDTEVHR